MRGGRMQQNNTAAQPTRGKPPKTNVQFIPVRIYVLGDLGEHLQHTDKQK